MATNKRERTEDVAKYAAQMGVRLEEEQREELWKRYGINGLAYVIAGWAMEFERKTRRRNWEYCSEVKGHTWDTELGWFLEAKIRKEGI